jgi:hypothetical protein
MLPRKPRSKRLHPAHDDGHRKVAVRVSGIGVRTVVLATAECCRDTALQRPGDFHDHGGMHASKDPDHHG